MGRGGPKPNWDTLDIDLKVSLALGSMPPSTWWFPGLTPKQQRESRQRCHQALVEASSAFALQICQALRDYRKAVVRDLELGSTATWDHIVSLWEDLGPTFDDVDDDDSVPPGTADGMSDE